LGREATLYYFTPELPQICARWLGGRAPLLLALLGRIEDPAVSGPSLARCAAARPRSSSTACGGWRGARQGDRDATTVSRERPPPSPPALPSAKTCPARDAAVCKVARRRTPRRPPAGDGGGGGAGGAGGGGGAAAAAPRRTPRGRLAGGRRTGTRPLSDRLAALGGGHGKGMGRHGMAWGAPVRERRRAWQRAMAWASDAGRGVSLAPPSLPRALALCAREPSRPGAARILPPAGLACAVRSLPPTAL
jgi:hypothetical protein